MSVRLERSRVNGITEHWSSDRCVRHVPGDACRRGNQYN
jgi:hypothetical protein